MVGASGAVAGILGAYLVLYPTSRIDTLVSHGPDHQHPGARLHPAGDLALPAAVQRLGSLGPEVANTGGVAYFAHIGGFVVGVAVGGLYRLSASRSDGDG